MISLRDFQFGPNARNRLADAADPSENGAVSVLESFYYALNQRDIGAMNEVWSHHELAQLDNPVGGILRGGDQAVALYRRIFASDMRLDVMFGDAATYVQPAMAVFAGRETGSYGLSGQPPSPLEIRTTRIFSYDNAAGRWVQLHRHGSIDDPSVLQAYQEAVNS